MRAAQLLQVAAVSNTRSRKQRVRTTWQGTVRGDKLEMKGERSRATAESGLAGPAN